MALKTQGTQIWFLKAGVTPTFEKVGCPNNLTGLGGGASQIDTTCLDSTEKTFVRGLPSPGKVTVALDFDPADTTHKDLLELYDSGDNTTWVVGLSDGVAPPTVNSAGAPVFPTTRTFISFNGYIDDFPVDASIDQILKSQMSVQRSGPRTFSFKT